MSKNGKQVRLDPDVQAALERTADRKGVSLSAAANDRLRAGLGIRPEQATPGRRRKATTPEATPDTTTTIESAAGRRSALPCPHPISRRIGPHCGACGTRDVHGSRR